MPSVNQVCTIRVKYSKTLRPFLKNNDRGQVKNVAVLSSRSGSTGDCPRNAGSGRRTGERREQNDDGGRNTLARRRRGMNRWPMGGPCVDRRFPTCSRRGRNVRWPLVVNNFCCGLNSPVF
ncbi:hypothetical protein Zmor_005013 [Zophobas morio]|uniref:Uncharacterized protein n=1 Tax=Zophobas morio TaxID=2755281 RepID=A0AA38ISC7_9CUCU|nr:hypothetical protein Zmor_004551 [Zophobas morio]KAJ3660571.1 hypothetical protein Zmor_005013 [Zophobas morio]